MPPPPSDLPRSIRIAGILLVASGITHVAQIFVYADAKILIGVSVFGVLYFAIGALLLAGRRGALWAGALLPILGGTAGLIRLLVVQPNPFSAWHVAVDLVVVPLCLLRLFGPAAGARGIR